MNTPKQYKRPKSKFKSRLASPCKSKLPEMIRNYIPVKK